MEGDESGNVHGQYIPCKKKLYDDNIEDFGQVGISIDSDKDILEKADINSYNEGRNIIQVPNSVKLLNDGGFSLASANHTILVGEGKICNVMRQAVHPKILSGPIMFPPTVRGSHLSHFHEACRRGQATVVVMGDSIFATASDMVSHTENATYAWVETLQQQNPGVKFRFVNAALGARNWADMNSDTCPPPDWLDAPGDLSWKAAVKNLQPDLLLINSTGNDVGNFSPSSVHELCKYFMSSEMPPSIILGISHLPSIASDINNYSTIWYQQGLDGVARWLRSYAQYHGIGYLDFYRWQSIRRDGFDPCELALTKIDIPDRYILPKTIFFKKNSIETLWNFPNIESCDSIYADKCTDFSISFELTKEVDFISISLSGVSENKLNVHFNKEKNTISYSWSDGVSDANSIIKDTEITFPNFPACFNVMVKGSRVFCSIWKAFQHSDWVPGHLASMGTGYQTICDETMVRFGGEFQPHIRAGGGGELIVHGLCVASALVVTGGGCRNRPDCTDNQLYQRTNHAGGSGHYHMNAYGVRDILAPIFRNQMWDDILKNKVI